ncbi:MULTISPECIES: pantoate--beta-alanine ligase [Alphaproteobacteria]|uniref:Pantothenate synthetase n=2 Tax=Alphaproteobacteria TaxID=28211 RepID=A0A512HMZ0_9HYPH|nr:MULTISPECIES: pantoate--beta-alanine ligase [Alphaproteobacteria]GEO86812.1 pantothenate synthetase [Ciceribacter naphthalenivorans]GLR23392.1 pantothenate synthetase [Ciceribacter naphthalenivorans]GLT06248.1 pantothenate synthetase [Sphingomonas psychrolutea]
METVTTIAELRARLAPHRQAGRAIGFVPTMGYLHKGHLTLVERAKAENAVTVISIFVNPLQFGANEDLAKYPRDLARDSALLETAGVDFLFAPGVTDMYPRPMETLVDVPKLGSELEGAARPGHFAGVATVVTKLFNIVQPDAAYFGEKDFQQVAIIRRMVEDLAQPVRVVPVPTVRETDGLACSSRNLYLTTEQRAAAVIVPSALDEAARLIRSGLVDTTTLEARIADFIRGEPLADPEIVALRDPLTLAAVGTVSGPVLLLLFVRIGQTRLLDNRVIDIASEHDMEAA